MPELVVRLAEGVDRPIAGDDLPEMVDDADATHRRRRRAGILIGGEGFRLFRF